MSDVDHDVVVCLNTFVPYCRICNAKGIDCEYFSMLQKSSYVRKHFLEDFKESPEEAYDRAMKGI